MEKEVKIKYQYFNSAEELHNDDRQLFEKALAAREKAYAPYSEFQVGCVIELDNGEIITANNQENAAYPSGLCAERAAIFWTAANYPEQKIVKLFVAGGPKNYHRILPATPPCGACRQSMLEYESKQKRPIEICFASLNGEVIKVQSVKDLLPFTFDGSFL